MSELIVITYDDKFKAEEVRLALLKMQEDYLVDLEDAVVASRMSRARSSCTRSTTWLVPGRWRWVLGLLIDALSEPFVWRCRRGGNRRSSALSDVGINDDFMKQLGATLTPGYIRAVRAGP